MSALMQQAPGLLPTGAQTCTFIIPLRGKAVTGVAYGAVGGRDYSGLVSSIKGSRVGTVPVARGGAHAETRVRMDVPGMKWAI